MIAPIDYTSQAANMFNQGVSSGLGMQRASMLRQEQESQSAAKEKQQAFNKSLQTAWDSGDNKQMIDLIASNPEQMQTIQDMLGIRDQQQKSNIANVAQQLNAAITSGNMQGAAGVINSNAEFLSSIGQDPQELLGDLQSDPQSLLRGAESMMLMTMTPDDVMKYKQKLEDQAISRRGQDIQMRGQDMSYASSNASRLQSANQHAENIAIKLREMSNKPALDSKDIKSINSDITAFNKDASLMSSAARDLETIRENATPAAQLAAIFKYMKALDPTSVVREGEQVMLQKTGGVFDTVGNYISQLNNGSRLNAKQLSDLSDTAKRLANSSISSVNSTIDDYLGTYGDNLTPGQKALFEKRKLKEFDVSPAKKSDISPKSRVADEKPKNQTPHATSREQINSDIKSMSTEDLLKLAYPGAK